MFRGLFFSKVTRNKIREILVKNHWRKLRWFYEVSTKFLVQNNTKQKAKLFCMLTYFTKAVNNKTKEHFFNVIFRKTLFEDFIDQIFLLWKIYFKTFSWKTAANMGRSFRLQLLRHWKVSKDWKSDGKVIGCAVKTAYS